jgi:hypothetical protein
MGIRPSADDGVEMPSRAELHLPVCHGGHVMHMMMPMHVLHDHVASSRAVFGHRGVHHR